MAWISEDGLHEAYLAAEFRDGERGIGVSGAGVPDDQIVVEADYVAESYRTRPAGEVVGWRIACNCSAANGRGQTVWSGSFFQRAPTKALEDIDGGHLWAPDDQVIDISGREDVESRVLELWQRDHLGTAQAIETVRRAAAAAIRAATELDQSVATARRLGMSWDAIGRAAGMTKQSAHQRWSSQVAEAQET